MKWKSKNKYIVKVSSKGLLYAIKPGKTKVFAIYNRKKYYCNVQVLKISKHAESGNDNLQNRKNVKTESSDVKSSLSPENKNSTEMDNTNSKIDQVEKDDNKKNIIDKNDLTPNNNESERNTKILDSKENVKAIDIGDKDENIKLDKKILDESLDIYSTNKDEEDSMIDYVVTNDNPLLQYILNGFYNKNDIIYMRSNQFFPQGMNYIYLSHDDNYQGNGNYNSDDNEVIHLEHASLNDVYEGDYFAENGGLDKDDPIQFFWEPDGLNNLEFPGIVYNYTSSSCLFR